VTILGSSPDDVLVTCVADGAGSAKYSAEGAQKDDFLRKHLICYDVRKIAGLTNSLVPMLESYGIESAYDVDKLNLTGIPSIHTNLALELLQWRTVIERQFAYQPEHGVTLQDMRHSETIATWRFKVSQARRVLLATTRLQAIADMAQSELDQALAKFDKRAGQWLEIARHLRDFQSERHELEFRLNRAPMTLLALTIGAPLVSGLFTWFLAAIR